MEKIPQHIAIIMDGNGRWAKKRGMPRNVGHSQGSKTVRKICEEAWKLGVKYLTVYAFSTENWSRPQDEIDALMKILRSYLKDAVKQCADNNMRVRIIGDISVLPEDMIKILKYFGKFTLVDSDEQMSTRYNDFTDEFYQIESNTYTYLYEFDEKDEEIVRNCLNVAYDGDFLN